MRTDIDRRKVKVQAPVQPELLAEAFLARTEDLREEKDNEPLVQLRSARKFRAALRDIEQDSVGQAVMRYLKLKGGVLELNTTPGEIRELVTSYVGPQFNKVYRYLYYLELSESGFRVRTEVSSSYADRNFFTGEYNLFEPREKVALDKTGCVVDEPGILKRYMTKLGLSKNAKAIKIKPLLAIQEAGLTLEKVNEVMQSTLLQASKEHKVEPPPLVPRVIKD